MYSKLFVPVFAANFFAHLYYVYAAAERQDMAAVTFSFIVCPAVAAFLFWWNRRL